MSTVVRHDLDFYPKVPSGGLHQVLLWQTFASGTRKMVESGYGADEAEALGDLLNRLTESGHADSMIRSVRESYVARRAAQPAAVVIKEGMAPGQPAATVMG
jgi:hypothetical protein